MYDNGSLKNMLLLFVRMRRGGLVKQQYASCMKWNLYSAFSFVAVINEPLQLGIQNTVVQKIACGNSIYLQIASLQSCFIWICSIIVCKYIISAISIYS
jgi:hypothetical protein